MDNNFWKKDKHGIPCIERYRQVKQKTDKPLQKGS